MEPALPAFEPEDVALLVSAVEKALEDMRKAIERVSFRYNVAGS